MTHGYDLLVSLVKELRQYYPNSGWMVGKNRDYIVLADGDHPSGAVLADGTDLVTSLQQAVYTAKLINDRVARIEYK